MPYIIEALTRDRFFLIRTNLHIVDKAAVPAQEQSRNRLWLVQPLIDSVRNRCLRLISKTKRIIIKNTEQGKILVRSEVLYRNDTCNPLAITKRGKSIAGIVPDRIENHFNVKSEKLRDVAKLLEKHFGADWRNLPDLKYYKNVLSHSENLPTQDDDDAVNDNPEYLLKEILNFVQ